MIVNNRAVHGAYAYNDGHGQMTTTRAVLHLLQDQQVWIQSNGDVYHSGAETAFSGFLVSSDIKAITSP